MTTYALKQYLLGPWMDTQSFPPYIKQKARDIFKSHSTWRTQWAPLDESNVVDTNWVFGWPKAGKELLDFLESTIYSPTTEGRRRS